MSFSDPAKIPQTGQVPLPPYIDRPPAEIDETMYQTVYAREEGSVASPTAGLHFTPEYLEKLRNKGVGTVFVTLHVGPGTFVPVRSSRVEDHKMHEEDYFVSEEAASVIEEARRKRRRIVAVGPPRRQGSWNISWLSTAASFPGPDQRNCSFARVFDSRLSAPY